VKHNKDRAVQMESQQQSGRAQGDDPVKNFTKSPESSNVIVEMCHDGCIKVYGPKNVNVTFVNRPKVSSVDAELKLEELIESSLPIRFAENYYPNALRAQNVFKPQTMQEFQHTVWALSADDAIRRAGNPDFYVQKMRNLVARALEITR